MSVEGGSFDKHLASIEKQARVARLVSLIITVIPVVIALIALFITINQIKQARTELAQAQTELLTTKEQVEGTKQELAQKTKEVNAIAAILKLSPDELLQLYTYGWQNQKIRTANENPALVEQSLKANEELKRLVNPADNERRKAITVAYFPKDVDAGKVDAALVGFGFKLVKFTPLLKDVPTNAIYYGNKVSLDDVKVIAYTLMRAGVQLKGIYNKEDTTFPIPEGTSRVTLIAVVSNNNANFLTRPPLTVDDIRNAKAFGAKDY
jgi:predicted Holliday junction resolvase-like endonuclease